MASLPITVNDFKGHFCWLKPFYLPYHVKRSTNLLTLRVARSLCDSWTSCLAWSRNCKIVSLKELTVRRQQVEWVKAHAMVMCVGYQSIKRSGHSYRTRHRMRPWVSYQSLVNVVVVVVIFYLLNNNRFIRQTNKTLKRNSEAPIA